jgi:hypothetical protein
LSLLCFVAPRRTVIWESGLLSAARCTDRPDITNSGMVVPFGS